MISDIRSSVSKKIVMWRDKPEHAGRCMSDDSMSRLKAKLSDESFQRKFWIGVAVFDISVPTAFILWFL